MVSGYGGVYRATVVDDADPTQGLRLRVVVPEVFGEAPVWAAASLPVAAQHALPGVGTAVSVSFEHGDTDYPVWEHTAGEDRAMATHGHLGKYHGVVVDADDPQYQRRLLVSVPEVDTEPVWAFAAGGAEYGELPAVGAGVWVEYVGGDPAHPRWVGLA